MDAAAPDVAPVEQVTADSEPRDLARLAPPLSRLLAFIVDVVVVAVVAAVPALLGKLAGFDSAKLFLVGLAVGLVSYLAVSVWLTGQTIGKALFGLTVRRMDGSAPPRTVGGLAWAVGRHSVGYLVIDVLGLGALAALVTPRRRCLHDYAFNSEVVVGDPSPQPRGARLRGYQERVEAAQEETNKRYAWVVFLWKWLTKLVLRPMTAVLFFAGGRPDSPVGRIRDRLADRVEGWIDRQVGKARPEASAPAAKPLSTKAALGLWAATAGLTGVAVVAALTVLPTPAIVGTWDGIRVQRTGLTSMVGVGVDDFTGPDSGCVFRSGEQVWKIRGRGPRYTGSTLWAQGRAGRNCTFKWSTTTAATFELLDHNTLEKCSTSPFSGRRNCDTFLRTD